MHLSSFIYDKMVFDLVLWTKNCLFLTKRNQIKNKLLISTNIYPILSLCNVGIYRLYVSFAIYIYVKYLVIFREANIPFHRCHVFCLKIGLQHLLRLQTRQLQIVVQTFHSLLTSLNSFIMSLP